MQKLFQTRTTNDSINAFLRFTDTAFGDSCLDVNCYITKRDFNEQLNGYMLPSTCNLDSIRTVILFDLIYNNHMKIKAEKFASSTSSDEDTCQENDTTLVVYHIRLLASTDSLLLAKTQESNKRKAILLSKPVDVIFSSLSSEMNNVADYIFFLQKTNLDFKISRTVLDSSFHKSWSVPIRNQFGFYSFSLLYKSFCHSDYINLKENIIRAIKSDDTVVIDEIDDYIITATDTLIVRFWSKPAYLAKDGRLDGIDTSIHPSFTITDYQLPSNIRKTVRTNYIKQGVTYFENYRNEYCVWNLKILNRTEGTGRATDNLLHYIHARQALLVFNSHYKKQNDKESEKRKNEYLSDLYRQYMIDHKETVNGNNIPINVIRQTEIQLKRSAFLWFKKNISFFKPIFNEKYLPKTITDNTLVQANGQ